MKMTKLSLIAAIAASSAIAGGDIKPVVAEVVVVEEVVSPWTFSGDAKLFYSTTDGDDIDLFSQESAIGQAAVSLDVSYAFSDTWKINAGITGLATLGLDDSVVGGVWLYAGANATTDPNDFTSIGDALWLDTLNISGTAFDGKASFTIGRMELDTPLAFTETWNIANNTFDAAVAMVNPMDSLTLVAGYIYDGNGNGDRITTPGGGFTGDNGYFPMGGVEEGAWTVAAIGKFDAVTLQAWYYDVIDIAQAIWVQADGNFNGITVGGQYAYIDPSDMGDVMGADLGDYESSAFAAKIGYSNDAFDIWAAYSSVDDGGLVTISNTATMLSGAGWGGASGYASGQSKLYTEAWWNYGFVGLPGAETFAVSGSYKVTDTIKLTAQYTSVTDALFTLPTLLAGEENYSMDMSEFTAILDTSFYGFDIALAYIYSDYTNNSLDPEIAAAGTYDNNTLQAYITYKF
jgi:hypothetical protein